MVGVHDLANAARLDAPAAGRISACAVSETAWAMTTGEAGMRNQALGLAEATGLPVETKLVRPPALWRFLPGHWAARAGVKRLAGPGSDFIAPPWPRVLITCGRRSAAMSIAIRRASGGQTLTVHVQNPLIPFAYFNLVIAPEHDGIRGANVHTSLGALHRITPERLAEGAAQFASRFAGLPHPRIAVLIGGDSGAFRFTPAVARRIAGELGALASQGAGLMVTPSRRTSAEAVALIKETLAPYPALIWDGEGDNPYFGMLALADAILVTEESVSMVSESCAAGKPVYTLALEGGSRRMQRFHALMRECGYVRPFAGALEPWTPPAPLEEARRYGALIRNLLRERGCGGSDDG